MADVTSEPKPSDEAVPVFNPFAQGFAEDPYPQYAELCAVNPVQRTPLGLWALFGYDDAVRLLRDPSLSDSNNANANAYAYHPESARSRRAGGTAAEPSE